MRNGPTIRMHPIAKHLQLIRTVDRLTQSETVAQIRDQLEGVHLLERHRRQRRKLPQQDAEAPHVAGRRVHLAVDYLQRHPLDGPILVVAQAMVVVGKEVAHQCRIADAHVQVAVQAMCVWWNRIMV